MTQPFVDRESELIALERLMRQVIDGTGGVLALEGSSGMGKTALIHAFLASVPGQRGGRQHRFIVVSCHDRIGAQDAYGPLLAAIQLLRPDSKRRRWFKHGVQVLRSTAPELLHIVPTVGPLLHAGASIALRPEPEGQLAGSQTLRNIPQTLCEAILEAVRKSDPTLLVIDDAHRIDASSCVTLEYLTHRIDHESLGIVIAYRHESITDDHPLRGLLTELRIRGLVRSLRLERLPEPALRRYVLQRSGWDLEEARIQWLSRVTGRYPLFVAQYLSLLEEDGLTALDIPDAQATNQLRVPIHSAVVPIPDSVKTVMTERISRIDAETNRLLMIGAVQGERFTTLVVEAVSRMAHEEVLGRLHWTCENLSVIRRTDPLPWEDENGVATDSYQFEHVLMRDVYLSQQSPQLLRERHAAVAEVLDGLASGLPNPSQELLLEVVHHLHHGGRPVIAIKKTLDLGRALALRGSLAEVESLCLQALGDVRNLTPNPASARLHAEIIELLLLATTPKWTGRARTQNDLRLGELALEAERAAALSSDTDLVARTMYLRGRIVAKTRSQAEALTLLKSAAEYAGEHGSAVSHFITMAEYGRQLTKIDLAGGLSILYDVEGLIDANPELRDPDQPILLHAVNLNRLRLASNLFDAGRYDESRRRLTEALTWLRSHPHPGELSSALNYLAQLQLATGDWHGGRATLEEAIATQTDQEASGWHAYNVALLARLDAEQGDAESARRLIRDAWAETERAWLVNLALIVCNIRAEVLLLIGAEWDEVEDILRKNGRHAVEVGDVRSEAQAESLLERLLMSRGDLQEALRHGRHAVEIVDRHGDLPALRTEELLYYHSEALRASGQVDEAESLVERARVAVRDKAGSLADSGDRERYLAIPLNQRIFS